MATPLFSLRLPEDLKQELLEIARREHRSLGNMIVKILREYLEKHNKE
jgi:predicted transcriptional regulator